MYNFDILAKRRNTNSLKWSVKENELPMWVADMDFYAPDFVTNKLSELVNVKNFGYKDVPEAYFQSFSSWWYKRHNFKFNPSDCIFSTGVVPAISSIVRKVTTVGEKVLVMEPCYNVFFNSIVNNGRFILSSNLIYKDYKYDINFKDLEEKLKDPQVSLMILCNPQNPVGRIWTRDELERIGRLAYENNVIVLSDEIHCDLVSPGKEYTPFASINDINKYNSITCISASKTFSLAGLQGACVVVFDKTLRYKVWRGINTDEVGESNSFVCETFIECFTKGETWVNELNQYIYKNKEYVYNYIEKNIKELKMIKSDALYLVWIDISRVSSDSDTFCSSLREKTGLFVSSGASYGKCGKTFIRVNLGTSLDNVKDAMERLKTYVDSLGNN